MTTAVTSIEDMGMTATATVGMTATAMVGMTATAMVGMAAGMTGVDIGIMKMATDTGFMWRRRSTMHHLQSRV